MKNAITPGIITALALQLFPAQTILGIQTEHSLNAILHHVE